MTFEIDCAVYSTKLDLLQLFVDFLDEMYSPNYDALIDALSTYENSLDIKLVHRECFDDLQNLVEVLQIAAEKNPLVTFS